MLFSFEICNRAGGFVPWMMSTMTQRCVASDVSGLEQLTCLQLTLQSFHWLLMADVRVTLDEPPDHPSPDRVVIAGPQCDAVIGTDLGFNLSPLQSAACSLYEPSIASVVHETDNVVDVGGKKFVHG